MAPTASCSVCCFAALMHVQTALVKASLNDKSAEKRCHFVSLLPKAPPSANICLRKKRKEMFMLFSDHKWSHLRRQPGNICLKTPQSGHARGKAGLALLLAELTAQFDADHSLFILSILVFP